MKRRAALGILLLVLVFDVLAVVFVYATAMHPPVEAVALFQTPPVVDGMPQQSMTGLMVTAVLGFLGLLAQQTFTMFTLRAQRKFDLEKAEQQRQWELQDRAAARTKLEQAQINAAVLLARGVRNSTEEVLQKIEENTHLTSTLNAALIGKKGCNVGATLADIVTALEQTRTKVEETKATVEEAKAVSTDTNAIVSKAAADLLASSDDAKKEGPA